MRRRSPRLVGRPQREWRERGEVRLEHWISRELSDENGLLPASRLLEWLDVAAAMAAARHCRQTVVVTSIDSFALREPIRLGDRVGLTARVAYTSEQGVGVSVVVTHGDRRGGAGAGPPVEAYLTYVPLDRRGRLATPPHFAPQTPAELARFRDGQRRYELRRRFQDDNLALRGEGPPPDEARHISYLHQIEPVPPSGVAANGALGGGVLLRLAEESARLSARAHVEGAAVRCTGLHGLTYLRPLADAPFVHVRSRVAHVSGSALTSVVTVHSEDPVADTYVENLCALFTYAPLESWVRVEPVQCWSSEERALHELVDQRIALELMMSSPELPA
jgi:acyl-CoA hydrolase